MAGNRNPHRAEAAAAVQRTRELAETQHRGHKEKMARKAPVMRNTQRGRKGGLYYVGKKGR